MENNLNIMITAIKTNTLSEHSITYVNSADVNLYMMKTGTGITVTMIYVKNAILANSYENSQWTRYVSNYFYLKGDTKVKMLEKYFEKGVSREIFINFISELIKITIEYQKRRVYFREISLSDFVITKEGSVIFWNHSIMSNKRNNNTGVFERIFWGRDPMFSEIENTLLFINKILELFNIKRTNSFIFFSVNEKIKNEHFAICKNADNAAECAITLIKIWGNANLPRIMLMKPFYLKKLLAFSMKGTRFVWRTFRTFTY